MSTPTGPAGPSHWPAQRSARVHTVSEGTPYLSQLDSLNCKNAAARARVRSHRRATHLEALRSPGTVRGSRDVLRPSTLSLVARTALYLPLICPVTLSRAVGTTTG